MKDKPKISVVIPAFNEEKYLPTCLRSLKRQTFRDYEIIVVDNNSTDATARIARSFGARVVRERKQGMTPARERGFKAAKAEIIARTDADTIVPTNWLEVIYKAFKKYPHVVGMTGPLVSSSPKIPNKLMSLYSYAISVRLGKLFSREPHLLGPNMAVRKSAWRKIKVHKDDTKVHEDIDLSIQLANLGQILYNPRLKVIFSFRRIEKDPVKGLIQYMGEYPLRYLKTISLNRKRLQTINKKRSLLKKSISNIFKNYYLFFPLHFIHFLYFR